MKKISFFVSVLLLSAGLVTLVNCSSTEVETEEVKLTVITSLERIGQDEPLFGESQASVKAAKNEYESFQVVVGAVSKNIWVVDAVMSDLKGDAGTISNKNVTLYRPEYVRVKRPSPRAQLAPGLYTYPLVPFINPLTGEPIELRDQVREYWPGPVVTVGHEMYALPFDLWKGQNQPVWVDIYIPEDTPAGEYKGTFTVTLDNFPAPWGPPRDSVLNKEASIPVNLTVWDFTLPDKATHRNHFGSVGSITARFGVEPGTEEYNEIEMRYCEMYSQHRLIPPFPRNLMPEMEEDGSLNIIPERHEALKKFI